LADWEANIGALRQPLLVEMTGRAAPHARQAMPGSEGIVFTDDRAPVEQMVHGIVLRYLIGSDH
jgi:hypothetical protein